MRFVIASLFTLMIVTIGQPAFAQDQGGSDDVSLFIGSLLPNQIDGVTEILPVFGGRYGLGSRIGTIEFGAGNSHAEGVDFSTLSMSLRGDVPVGDGLEGLIYGGIDFNWYRPVDQTDRKSETGFHIGAGGLLMVSDSLWLRTDLKFMGGPGTSLYLLFGLLFRSSGGQ